MSPTNDCHSFQLIDGKGKFNNEGLHKFITDTNLPECRLDYAIIAIIGPQSRGKSTFMNHFGGTNFKEMDSEDGCKRETQGIWIAKCVTIQRPFTIAMDIEGTDSQERGEDTAFEGQSALFGLAVADTLIINLACIDIGKKTAACKTLLQTVLQIRMRMERSKVKLCFLLRDKTNTPFTTLEKQVNSNMEEIWAEITRSNGFEGPNISDFFHVLVFCLPHYEFRREEFEDEVAKLRGKILPVDSDRDLPAVAFQANLHKLWENVKDEPLLNLPAHSVMVAEHMCKEIANSWLKNLASSENLMELKKEVEAGLVSEFGDKLHSLMETTLSKYLREVRDFKESIVKEREEVLKSEILKILHPLYVTNMGHLRDKTFQNFKTRLTEEQMKGVTFKVACRESYDTCERMFEEQSKGVVEKLSAGWDWLGCYTELFKEIENYAKSKNEEKYQKLKVDDYIKKSLEYKLYNCTGDTYWESIREVVRMSTSEDNGIIFSYADATDWQETSLNDKMTQELQTYARNVVVDKLRAEADKNVVKRMKTRYGSVLCWDEASIRRDLLDQTENAEAIRHEARTAAIKFLSVMAVVQFDEQSNNCIEGVLLSSLKDPDSTTVEKLKLKGK